MKKNHWLLIEISAAVLAISVLVWIMVPKFLEQQNLNTPNQIPDHTFREIMERYMEVDTDERYTIKQAKETEFHTIFINDKNIHSLKGIEYFTGIQKLICSYNQLTTLDLSQLVNLQSFIASDNKLVTVLLPKSSLLKSIGLSSNQFESLDISNYSGLTQIHAFKNGLRQVKISNNHNLKYLSLSYNNIAELDISTNPNLEEVFMSHNPLENLTLPHKAPIKKIDLAYTGLQRLPELCKYNDLTSIDLRGIAIHKDDWIIIETLEERLGKSVDISNDDVVTGIVYDDKDLEKWEIQFNKD